VVAKNDAAARFVDAVASSVVGVVAEYAGVDRKAVTMTTVGCLWASAASQLTNGDYVYDCKMDSSRNISKLASI
jgi:hypothetical protein